MKAVILCGCGEKGLMPINERTPDCLLDICGQTPLSLCIGAAENAGLKDPVIVTDRHIPRLAGEYGGYELIRAAGNIGSLLSERAAGGSLLIQSADSASEHDIAGLLDLNSRLAEQRPAAVILACKSCMGHGCAVRSDSGRLAELCSADRNNCGDSDGFFGGAAVLSPELSARLGDYDFQTLAELVCALLADDEYIAVYYSPYRLLLPDTPRIYRRACLAALESSPQEFPELPNVTLIPPVYIGKGASIGDGCIISDCVIGKGARIEARCELSGCVIGECAVLSAGVSGEEAVVCRSAEIGAFVRLGRESAVGENAVIGSGSDIAAGVMIRADVRIAPDKLVTDDCSAVGSSSHSLDDDDCFMPDSAAYAPIDCVRLGMSVGGALGEGSAVICGCSGDQAAAALMSAFENGLSAVGVTAMTVGESSPAEVMFLISRLGAQLGCFVSAECSCKIRLISKGGLPLDSRQRSCIERTFALRLFRTLPFADYAERRELSGAKALYAQFLSQNLPERFIGFGVDVRCSDLRLSRLADRLFRQRGDINGERIIFHISNDGTECTAYTDELGNVSHERLLLLAAKACFEKDLPVSLPFSFPTAADKVAESLAGKLYRYRHFPEPDSDIAARTVASRPDNFFVRDAMVLICVICSYINERRLTAASALSSLPEFATARRLAAGGMSANEAYERLGAAREGGEGVVGRSGGRASVRQLKDRRGLMIYAESTSVEAAADICEDILKTLGIDRGDL